jgi:hypothetical protein
MAHTGRHARSAATQVPVTFVAFDLVHLAGEDLAGRWSERKVMLDGLRLVGPAWATNGWYCDGDALFAVAPSTTTRVSWPSGSTRPLVGWAKTWLKRKSPEWNRVMLLAGVRGVPA